MTEQAWSMNPARARWAQGNDGTNAAAPDTVITDELSVYNLSMPLFAREVIARGFGYLRTTSWATDAAEIPTFTDFQARHEDSREALILSPDHDTAACLSLGGGRLQVRVAGRSQDLVDQEITRLLEALPVTEIDPEEPRVPVTFWSLSSQGPVARTRQIDVPEWPAIAGNYTAGVGDVLAGLMTGFQPGVGGQLLLWHGVPGTGKTWALRALAWEWRAWADLHYVTDPEVFFGDSASYMLDVLLHEHDGMARPVLVRDDDDVMVAPALEPDPRAQHGRWKLLVLEDTGELMSADARERSGQGLSRLLNVVDGLIGQGLRVLVLVTTNEELRTLHPAVQRPGRCASKLLFEQFGTVDARAWLAAQGVPAGTAREMVGDRMTVADLFAALEERETTRDRGRSPVGFSS